MEFPVHVSFRNLGICDAVENLCWEQAGMLEPWSDQIETCWVTITSSPGESPPLCVRIELSLLGHRKMVATGEPSSPGTIAVELAVRDAFSMLRRRLRGSEWMVSPGVSRGLLTTRIVPREAG